MPEITVITSTHNRRSTLKRTIKSVLSQSYKDFEYIIVDDCSDYDVKKLVDSFKDDRIRFFKTETNFGHDGRPKNIGIKESLGKYICFLDDDDLYRKDALKILHTYIKESGVEVVYGDYINVLPDGKISPGWSEDFSIARLLKHNYISMVVAMIRSDRLKAIGGFDEQCPKYKDWNVWIRLYKSGCDFLHIPIITTDVHQSEDCISSRYLTECDENGLPKPTYFNLADCYLWPDKTYLGERKPLRVAVYTLTNGRLSYLKKSAELMDRLAGYDFDWFIIENGSSDGTKDWLKAQDATKGAISRRRLVYGLWEGALGVGRAWNKAIDLVGTEYDVLVKVDDDAMFLTDGWLRTIVSQFERSRRLCLSPSVEGLENSPGGVLRMRSDGQSPYVIINEELLGMVPHLGGIVYATDLSIWEGFRFDEESVGNKDVLLSSHARRNGRQLYYLENVRVSHGPHGTAAQKEDYPNRV